MISKLLRMCKLKKRRPVVNTPVRESKAILYDTQWL